MVASKSENPILSARRGAAVSLSALLFYIDLAIIVLFVCSVVYIFVPLIEP